MSDYKWLKGWPRIGFDSVLIGTGVFCAGCGKYGGTTCVGIDKDWVPPTEWPDWPFKQEDCPICELESKVMELRDKLESKEDKLTARLLALKNRSVVP